MDNAFKYVHDNKGIDDEKTYPYVGKVRFARRVVVLASHERWFICFVG